MDAKRTEGAGRKAAGSRGRYKSSTAQSAGEVAGASRLTEGAAAQRRIALQPPSLILSLGVLLFVAVAWVPHLAGAKSASLEVLNSEFGSALFLAGALSFIASAASQYWRFLDARRQYYILSNREQAEAAARAERLKADEIARAERQKADQAARDYRARERMLEAYQWQRSTIQGYSFWMYQAQRSIGLESGDQGLQRLANLLVRIAIGPDRTFETVTSADVDRLAAFRGYFVSKQLDEFANAVIKQTPEIGEPTKAKIANLFAPPAVRTTEATTALISELLLELEALEIQ
ncbi:MAG: hypothetical protein B7Y90_16840 [Alphaproteobacteria bacterium 32-64-14]|nr:MAG: hypothetical protein B7Y90_16840 [Alphaproteobacteria bacterium 32-64-14]